MNKFVFNISEIKPILADTMKANEHMFVYGVESLKTNVPGLWLCQDPTCCFLQSNAVKPRRKPDASVWRVYAHGCEPGGRYKGDGRCELIEAGILNEIMREAAEKECHTLKIIVDDHCIRFH